MGTGPAPQAPKTPVWEPIAILLAIVALWPMIYVPGQLYAQVLMYAAGVLMVVVLVCKIRRMKALWNRGKKG